MTLVQAVKELSDEANVMQMLIRQRRLNGLRILAAAEQKSRLGRTNSMR